MTKNSPLRSKIRGTFLGLAIGDAIGKAVETWTPQQIVEKHGRIEKYLDCAGHKWFDGDKIGTWTDDTQLSLAVARGLIESEDFDLNFIAKEHVKEYLKCVLGWGGSTKEAVQRLSDGVHWSEAGFTDIPGRGTGNGVCMKVAPIGLFMALTNPDCKDPPWNDHIIKIVQLSTMTHRTSLAITSGLAHSFAILKCLITSPTAFDKFSFVRMMQASADMGKNFLPETIKDDLSVRFKLLENDYAPLGILDPEVFGGGSCYAYDSLPFTYAWFLRNPTSIESLYNCVSGGGDTDTNGSMLGSLLGALNGEEIFPAHLVEGLDRREEIMEVADKFCEKFLNN